MSQFRKKIYSYNWGMIAPHDITRIATCPRSGDKNLIQLNIFTGYRSIQVTFRAFEIVSSGGNGVYVLMVKGHRFKKKNFKNPTKLYNNIIVRRPIKMGNDLWKFPTFHR